MSQTESKTARQSKSTEKTIYQFRITDENYDFLIKLSEEEGLSVPAILNRLVRDLRRAG